MNLKGKVALVTGASRGLGRAIALALGQASALPLRPNRLVKYHGQPGSLRKKVWR